MGPTNIMKKIAILLSNEIKDADIFIPTSIWRKAKIIVDLISIEKKNSVILESGVKISCNYSFDEVNITQYHGIYIPGGNGLIRFQKENWPVKNSLGSDKLLKTLETFQKDPQKKIMLTFDSAKIFRHYNLVNGYRIAGYNENHELDEGILEEIVIHNNLISVKGYWQLPQFALEVINSILDEKSKENIEKILDSNSY